ncbi:MAG: Glu/Leu/Phe/Val dehydrogenase dimerization domain-containing protein [Pseudomonadota bacterium]
MSVLSAPAYDHHELVAFHEDEQTGLRAIIAVHNSRLGPAVGGCRMFDYQSDEEALHDVLRLSRGMTYKSALAGLPLGGGKSVIIGDPRRDKTPALLRAMGDFVNSQGGRYVAAEDSGTGVSDIRTMAERTPWVNGLDDNAHGGDPSPSTALGVYLAIEAAVRHRLGTEELSGLRVAIQGLGNVGYFLAERLVAAGAEVFGADVVCENVKRAAARLGVIPASTEDILTMEVDVLAPCAMGAVLNAQSIPRLRAGIVAGAANNQLATEEDGVSLAAHGILYCPDFLINAGGIIDVHYQRSGAPAADCRAHIARISDRLRQVLQRADENRQPTARVAEGLAEEILGAARRLAA